VIGPKDDYQNYIFGNNITPGEEENHYSYYSVLFRLIGAVFYWIILAWKFNLKAYKIEIQCNRLEAIAVANR